MGLSATNYVSVVHGRHDMLLAYLVTTFLGEQYDPDRPSMALHVNITVCVSLFQISGGVGVLPRGGEGRCGTHLSVGTAQEVPQICK